MPQPKRKSVVKILQRPKYRYYLRALKKSELKQFRIEVAEYQHLLRTIGLERYCGKRRMAPDSSSEDEESEMPQPGRIEQKSQTIQVPVDQINLSDIQAENSQQPPSNTKNFNGINQQN